MGRGDENVHAVGWTVGEGAAGMGMLHNVSWVKGVDDGGGYGAVCGGMDDGGGWLDHGIGYWIVLVMVGGGREDGVDVEQWVVGGGRIMAVYMGGGTEDGVDVEWWVVGRMVEVDME